VARSEAYYAASPKAPRSYLLFVMHLSCIHLQARRPLAHSGNPTRTATLKQDTGGMARGELHGRTSQASSTWRPLLCKFRPPTSIRLPSQVSSLSKSKSARFGLFMLLLLWYCCCKTEPHNPNCIGTEKRGCSTVWCHGLFLICIKYN
jgi:hypothetical protein